MTRAQPPHDGPEPSRRTHQGPTDGPAGRDDSGALNTAGQGAVGPENRHERLTPGTSAVRLRGPGPAGTSGVALSAERCRRRGAGKRGLSELLTRLSARDIALIDLLAEHRFLTTQQLQAFCFYDHTTIASASRTARRVLARLAAEDVIERAARRVGGIYAGSEAHIWRLTGLGHRLRSLRAGVGTGVRVRTPSARFIDHYLAIADVRLQLVSAERQGRLLVTQVQIEPLCWQRYTGLGGSREVLKPDLAATTTPADQREYEDHWYIEVDRATESIPTVLRQCRAYEACRQSGAVQEIRGVFPIVIWVVPTERRANNLLTALRQARALDASLYRVCTPDQLLPLILGGAA